MKSKDIVNQFLCEKMIFIIISLKECKIKNK